MLYQPLTYKTFILYILIIIICIFSINLFIKYNNKDSVEHFKSILNNFNSKKTKSNLKKKVTFEDILKESEELDPSKYTVSNIKKSFFTYINSFSKDKFKNVSGTTHESLEKFSYFKDKFFDIFI